MVQCPRPDSSGLVDGGWRLPRDSDSDAGGPRGPLQSRTYVKSRVVEGNAMLLAHDKPKACGTSADTATSTCEAFLAVDDTPIRDTLATKKLLGIATIWDASPQYRCAIPLWCQSAKVVKRYVRQDAEIIILAKVQATNECKDALFIYPLTTHNAVLRYNTRFEANVRRLPWKVRDSHGIYTTGGWAASNFRFANLLKMSLLALESQFEVILFSDLDLYLPFNHFDGAKFRSNLHSFINSSMLFSAKTDHASPVNGGLWMLKPRCAMHAEAMTLLNYANWTISEGFNNTGRPQSIVSQVEDPGLMERLGAGGHGLTAPHKLNLTAYWRRNVWSFVGGGTDQGLLWYLFYLKHPYGTWGGYHHNIKWQALHFWSTDLSMGMKSSLGGHKMWSSSGHSSYWQLLNITKAEAKQSECFRFASRYTAAFVNGVQRDNSNLHYYAWGNETALNSPRTPVTVPMLDEKLLSRYDQLHGANVRKYAAKHLIERSVDPGLDCTEALVARDLFRRQIRRRAGSLVIPHRRHSAPK